MPDLPYSYRRGEVLYSTSEFRLVVAFVDEDPIECFIIERLVKRVTGLRWNRLRQFPFVYRSPEITAEWRSHAKWDKTTRNGALVSFGFWLAANEK